MIAPWMLYCAVVCALLGLAALALEHALNRRGVPLRGVWMIAILGSLALAAAPWLRSSPLGPGASPEVPGGEVAVAADPMLRRGVPGEIASILPLETVRAGVTSLAAGPSALQAFDRSFLVVWVLTSSSALVLLLGAHRRLGRRRRRWRADVIDGVPVLVSKDVGPAVVGFVRTEIVVPEWVAGLDADRRHLVLAHEREHLRAADPALLLAAFAVVVMMPWNAPLWWQVRRLRHAVELDCDARVLRGTHDAAAYGELLVDVGEQVSNRRLGLAAFAESSSFLAARIRNLRAPRPPVWRALAGVTVAAAALAFALACEAPTPVVTAAPAAQAHDDRLGLGPDASALVAAVEAEGAAHPRPENVRPFAPHPRTGLELVGVPERRCVLVPEVDESRPKVIRSGEFVILGRLPELEAGRRFRLSWTPLVDAFMQMELDARAWRVDGVDEAAVIEVAYVTAPQDSYTLDFYADEAWFLGGAQFPSAGTWIVVGRTGRSWGCFVFSVPERR